MFKALLKTFFTTKLLSAVVGPEFGLFLTLFKNFKGFSPEATLRTKIKQAKNIMMQKPKMVIDALNKLKPDEAKKLAKAFGTSTLSSLPLAGQYRQATATIAKLKANNAKLIKQNKALKKENADTKQKLKEQNVDKKLVPTEEVRPAVSSWISSVSWETAKGNLGLITIETKSGHSFSLKKAWTYAQYVALATTKAGQYASTAKAGKDAKSMGGVGTALWHTYFRGGNPKDLIINLVDFQKELTGVESVKPSQLEKML